MAHIIGDNLGIHEILNLSTCFSSGPCCRECHVTYREIQTNPFDTHQPRITSECPLLSIPDVEYIHLAPPDSMHNFNEGLIVKYTPVILKSL